MTGTSRTVTAAVAQHVRALRHARGWSLDELSGRSGVSKGMVVQVEGARTNPSIGTLCRLADAFDVEVGRLLGPGDDRRVRVNAAREAPVLWRGGFGGFGRLLAAVTGPAPVELWEWGLAPGDGHCAAGFPPGTRALLYVLAGTVVVTVDDIDHQANAGDVVEFPADRGYGFRNDTGEPARLAVTAALGPGTGAQGQRTGAQGRGPAAPGA